MRILYHHRTLADGAEGVHIAEMVGAFRDLGHEVRVLGMAAPAAGAAPGGLVGAVRRALPGGVYELASAALNGPEYVEVRRALRLFRPDFLYKRHARNDVAALAAARALRVPSVLEVNCLYSTAAYRRFEPLRLAGLAARLEEQALRAADVVVAVSSPLAAGIREFGISNVRVVPNGANPARFDPARAIGTAVRTRFQLGTALVIGWAGILRDWHGLDLLLEALAAVPDARLLLVGDGPARASVEGKAAALGVAERVVFAGRVPHEAMAEHIAAMDVAVVAADRTGVASPMKLLEYMALERAVVAPRLDNIRDLVEDGVDGLLFEDGNARALAAALGRLADRPELRRALAARARRKVEESRNWRRNAQTVLSLVEDVRGRTQDVMAHA